MRYDLVLFDFDGTLSDSFPWFAAHLDQAADRFRLQRVPREDVETLRNCEATELLKRFKVPFWKFPLVAHYMRHLMAKDIKAVGLFPGAADLLTRLRKGGATLGVVSSNSESNVRHVFGHELSRLVSYYECGVSMQGKAVKIDKLVRRSKTVKGRTVFIGDECRDIDAAQRSGVDSGVVMWGYNHVCVLQKHSPTLVFDTMDDILQKLEVP